MFKRDKKVEQQPAPQQRSAMESEAALVIAKADRLKHVSAEAAMWRRFAIECAPGRDICEYNYFTGHGVSLKLTMDRDTAPMWKDFALRMAEDRERRLRDLLT